MLASIQFERYYFSRIDFKYTPDSESVENKGLEFGHEVRYLDSDEIEVIVNCTMTDESGLLLQVTMHGFFKLEKDEESDPEEVALLCEKNTVAIMFPYLRSAVSDISLKANTSPIILPTVNIVSLLENSKKIIAETEDSKVKDK